jgi:hypothetical protein
MMNRCFGASEPGFWTCTPAIKLDAEFEASRVLKADLRIVRVSQQMTRGLLPIVPFVHEGLNRSSASDVVLNGTVLSEGCPCSNAFSKSVVLAVNSSTSPSTNPWARTTVASDPKSEELVERNMVCKLMLFCLTDVGGIVDFT